jgi:hypothetical protein
MNSGPCICEVSALPLSQTPSPWFQSLLSYVLKDSAQVDKFKERVIVGIEFASN